MDTFDRGGDLRNPARAAGLCLGEPAAQMGVAQWTRLLHRTWSGSANAHPPQPDHQRSRPVTILASSCWPLPAVQAQCQSGEGFALGTSSCACISPFYPRRSQLGGAGPPLCGVPVCFVLCADSPTLECNGPAHPHSMSSCTWRASSEARMPDALHSRCEPALPALLEADTGWVCLLQRVEGVPRRCNGLGGRPIICVQMGWLSILAPPSAEVIHCDGGEHETSDSAQR